MLTIHSMSAYFGDLKDGVHKGDAEDPRISVIEVVPDEIRYWVATKGSVARAAEVALSSVTGKTVVPGELRTITQPEVLVCPLFSSQSTTEPRQIQLTQKLHTN